MISRGEGDEDVDPGWQGTDWPRVRAKVQELIQVMLAVFKNESDDADAKKGSVPGQGSVAGLDELSLEERTHFLETRGKWRRIALTACALTFFRVMLLARIIRHRLDRLFYTTIKRYAKLGKGPQSLAMLVWDRAAKIRAGLAELLEMSDDIFGPALEDCSPATRASAYNAIRKLAGRQLGQFDRRIMKRLAGWPVRLL